MAMGCWMQVPWWPWLRTGQQWPPSGSASLTSWWNPSKNWALSGREQVRPESSGAPTGHSCPADSRVLSAQGHWQAAGGTQVCDGVPGRAQPRRPAGACSGTAHPVLQPPWRPGHPPRQPHGHPLHLTGCQVLAMSLCSLASRSSSLYLQDSSKHQGPWGVGAAVCSGTPSSRESLPGTHFHASCVCPLVK